MKRMKNRSDVGESGCSENESCSTVLYFHAKRRRRRGAKGGTKQLTVYVESDAMRRKERWWIGLTTRTRTATGVKSSMHRMMDRSAKSPSKQPLHHSKHTC